MRSPWLIHTAVSPSSPSKRGWVVLVDDREAVFAFGGRDDTAAQLVREQLHAVADAEYRDSALEYPRLGQRCAVLVDGCGPAGEDDALQVEPVDGCAGSGGGDEFAVNVLLADASGDEPAVLRAVVDDGDAFGFQGFGLADAPALAGGLLALLGDAQIGGDFNVAARRHPVRPVGERRWGVVVGRVHAVLSNV